MPTEPSPPQLDFSSIDFPMDRVTLGQMRRVEPSVLRDTDVEVMEVEAFALFHFERLLAERAFASTLSLPDPYPEEDRDDLVQMLDRAYQKYGLSTGTQQSKQLVRDFERAATTQAMAHGGQRPR